MMGKKELIEDVVNREYVLNGEKTYCLYDDINQTTLFAMAYSEEQLKEVTKYYTSGVWFEYDDTVDSNMVLNERKFSKRVRFPKVALEREIFGEEKENKYKLSSGIGDLR